MYWYYFVHPQKRHINGTYFIGNNEHVTVKYINTGQLHVNPTIFIRVRAQPGKSNSHRHFSTNLESIKKCLVYLLRLRVRHLLYENVVFLKNNFYDRFLQHLR